MITCGLDFGTSNSAIAAVRGGEAAMCPCFKRRRIRRVAHIQSNDDSRSRDKLDAVPIHRSARFPAVSMSAPAMPPDPLPEPKPSSGHGMSVNA
jgi:hypothetical protein